MKNLSITLVAFVAFFLSCTSKKEDTIPQTSSSGRAATRLELASSAIRTMYSDAFYATIGNTTSNLEQLKPENIIWVYNPQKGAPALASFLKQNYFSQATFNYQPIIDQALKRKGTYAIADIDDLSYFSYAQKKVLGDIFINLPNRADLSAVIPTYRNWIISTSSMTEDQKIEILGVVEGLAVLSDYFSRYGTGAVYYQESSPGGRVSSDCQVNWRNVWIGGVVNGARGAIAGAYAGATTGTFTVPVLGTATGAVGGAVFGFASGFVVGSVTAIAVDLLRSCGGNRRGLPAFLEPGSWGKI
jgi:hypothetical protein